ncbi:MAG: ABC transporter substrate-binding protein, partial [Thermosynechococcaceae cyanobacterium]
FKDAAQHFNLSLKANSNDPEALIYLNNALAVDNSLLIAAVVPIGRNVNVAKETLRGIAQSQYEINQRGGIKGKRLQVLIVNDEDDPELAKALAIKLAQNPRVLAVVGHESSQAAITAAHVYNRHGIVMVSPSAYAQELTNAGRFIFRTTPNSRVMADRLAQLANQKIPNAKVAICYDSTAPDSQSFRDDFVAAIYAAGGTMTQATCDFASPNFNPYSIPSQAVRDGATTLLLAPALKNLNQAIAVMKANQGRLAMMANQSMYTFDTLQKGRASGTDMTLAVPWDAAHSQSKTYSLDANKLWQSQGSWRTAMAYDATQVIGKGLSMGANRQVLQQALANPGFKVEGVTGSVEFLPTGDRNGKSELVNILPGKRSGIGFDFVTFKP